MEKAEKNWMFKCNWMEMRDTPSFLGGEYLELEPLTTQNTLKFKCFDIPINFFFFFLGKATWKTLGSELGIWSLEFGAWSLKLGVGLPQLNATRRDNKIIRRRHLETISISHKKPGQHRNSILQLRLAKLAFWQWNANVAGKLVLLVVVLDVLSLIWILCARKRRPGKSEFPGRLTALFVNPDAGHVAMLPVAFCQSRRSVLTATLLASARSWTQTRSRLR